MTDSDEVKLLPCPFCGSEATFEQPYEGSWVFCSNTKCNAYQARHTAKDAIAAWNARAIEATRPPVVTDEVVDALAVARADLTHLGERYGMQEFVAPTICRINAALASMPAVVSGGQGDA